MLFGTDLGRGVLVPVRDVDRGMAYHELGDRAIVAHGIE